jgi:hypothetical protein
MIQITLAKTGVFRKDTAMTKQQRRPKARPLSALKAAQADIESEIVEAEAREFRRVLDCAEVAGVDLALIDNEALIAALKGLRSPFRGEAVGAHSAASKEAAKAKG